MPEIRLAAERKYEAELRALAAADPGARPPGWSLTPRAVETYVMGTDKPVGGVAITPKYIGDRALVQVAIATLASDRALMLTGEPGTAKSWLSEHLTAAISGTSALVVQGTAGTSEEHLKYGWNYALLLADGPSERALVPSPIYRAMKEGKVARFEEITRTSAEVQDALISILSEKQIAIPELGSAISAERGFSIIATANTRDRGVNEMSAALKRRFNFETVFPIPDMQTELALVRDETRRLLERANVPSMPGDDVLDVLVTTFRELRAGQTADGQAIERLSVPMSTAEAVSVAYAVGVRGHYLGGGRTSPADVVECLAGAAVKDDKEDLNRLRQYFEQRVSKRKGAHWQAFYEARHRLPG